MAKIQAPTSDKSLDFKKQRLITSVSVRQYRKHMKNPTKNLKIYIRRTGVETERDNSKEDQSYIMRCFHK